MDINELIKKLPAETDPEILNGILEFATNALTQIETLTNVNEALRNEYISRFTESVKTDTEPDKKETETDENLSYDDLFKE